MVNPQAKYLYTSLNDYPEREYSQKLMLVEKSLNGNERLLAKVEDIV